MQVQGKSPLEIMQMLKNNQDKERINKIFKLGVVKAENGELIIPSYKCKIYKPNQEAFFKYFCFNYQVFWREIELSGNLDFAISELHRILGGEKSYLFENGTRVELEEVN